MNQIDKDKYWQELNALTFNYINKNFSLFTPIGREAAKRKLALMYRWSAIPWHISMTEQTASSIRSGAKQEALSGKLPPYLHERLFHTGYLFDDVVFNLVSMFDYLAGFIDLAISKDRCRRKNWNKLVSSLRHSDFKDSDTCKLLVQSHNTWVNKLAGYRAAIYHEKSDPGSLEFVENLKDHNVQINFFVPEGAAKSLPLFKGRSHVDLIDGLNEILDISSNIQLDILKAFVEKPFIKPNPEIF